MTGRRWVNRVLSVSVCLLACSGLPGCWGALELDDMSIVIGIALDRTEDGMTKLTAEVVSSSQLQTGQGAAPVSSGRGYLLYTSTGDTVEDASFNFVNKSYRRLYYGHNSVVVFSKAYAEHGIAAALDYFERNREFRKDHVLVVSSDTAADVLGTQVGQEKLPTRSIQALINHGMESSIVPECTQLRIMNQSLTPSNTFVVPVIGLQGGDMVLQGSAVFQGECLATIRTIDETRGLLWLLGDVHGEDLVLPCPHSPHGNAVRVLHASTRVRPSVEHGLLTFHVQARGNVELQRVCTADVVSPLLLRKVEKATSDVVQSRMKETLTDLQRDRLDAVQFGTRLFRSQPALYRKYEQTWGNKFAQAQVVYDVQFNVVRSGLTNNPPFSAKVRSHGEAIHSDSGSVGE